ncbi:cytochrome C5 [Oleiphilus messinensis]|uniref:Cytochrome C5 n=1 Tax=Oleiphilus messinensis TaxID=141451 RepID=A0A1Y0IEK0_9GAMM|nr:cytochrome c5 family protein [Oleiphilus messinensis]ARU58871.1 cytochrome C5 [Oleiphilus messinensis]
MKNGLKLLAMFLMVGTSFVQASSDAAIEERIKPVGEVCVQGDPCADAAPVAAAASSGPRSGEEVYNTKCAACHSTGAAGAPVSGNAAQWAPRIEQGLETLVSHAINGFNAMPARGTCMDCSDEEVGAAVEFMVDASK